ncbi:MAG: GAF domain-containing protein [Mangrovicoccus sp.]
MAIMDVQNSPMSPAKAPTFVRVAEVWTPNKDGTALNLASGLYGDLADFAAASAPESFAYGEGLPGKAWAEARPVILKGFRGSYFKRTEAAEAAGLTAAIALPVFDGNTLKAVVTFLFADDDRHVGAVEIWSSASEGVPMSLEDGYYGRAEHFEWISRHTAFPKGSGLPGSVWSTAAPVIYHDLGNSHRFIRSQGAAQAGLTAGLGIPMSAPGLEGQGQRAVTLLSALGTPFARQVKVFTYQEPRSYVLTAGFGADGQGLLPAAATESFQLNDGILGIVAQTGVPVAQDLPEDQAGDMQSLVALPILGNGHASHIIAWYF